MWLILAILNYSEKSTKNLELTTPSIDQGEVYEDNNGFTQAARD